MMVSVYPSVSFTFLFFFNGGLVPEIMVRLVLHQTLRLPMFTFSYYLV